MSEEADGATVIVPAGGPKRLHLLEAALASMRRAAGVDQIVISEVGSEAFALPLAQLWGADHVFSLAPGFNRARAMNAGSRLARRPELVYCDGDLLFGADFLPRALEEFRASGLDCFLPFSTMEYLEEACTTEVLAGRRPPGDCQPLRVLRPLLGGLPGAMGMVRADFLARHGGMIEGFRGWGFEDNAWVHKVMVLGQIGGTARTDQPVWHLFHKDSGSHSAAANRRAGLLNPDFDRNVALFRTIEAIRTAEDMSRQFPPRLVDPPPWPAASRIVFAVVGGGPKSQLAQMATAWSDRLDQVYGTAPAVVRIGLEDVAAVLSTVAAEAVVGFASSAAGCAALAATGRLSILVPGPAVTPAATLVEGAGRERPWVLARDAGRIERWEALGAQVWHRAWDEDGALALPTAPVVAQPLSQVLGAPRLWRVRITLDRAALPQAALDRPAFWYVALHDADGAVVVRQDADRGELRSALSRPDGVVVLERQIRAARPPAWWIVQPADRRRQWLQQLSGAADASASLAG